MPNKIDSNITTFSVAEETSLGVLGGSPIWFGMNVNSYSDLGASVEKVARAPIDGTRQRLKGSVAHISSQGGINIDLTNETLSRLFQGFMFANANDPFSTWPRNGTKLTITAVAAGTGVYSAASGLTGFIANNLVRCSGFTNAANNGVFKVTSATATTLTTNNTSSVVETPASTAKIEVIGHEFASGDIVQTVSGGTFTITATAGGAAFSSLNVGQWVFIGGDVVGQQFATGGNGYARISAKPTNGLTFDKSTYTPVADTGAGKTIRVYFPRFVKNATSSSGVTTRSFQLERQLGNDGNGIQSEYIIGSVANEVSFNFKMKENITTDMSFVGINGELRTGLTGVKSGTRLTDVNETPYNASTDVWRTTVAPVNIGTINPTAYLGFVTDYKITINNNVSGLDAIGEVTSFDVNVGSFDVGGDIEAYFTTLDAITAIKANGNVTFDSIICSLNADGLTYGGKVIDIPLIELSGGLNNVVKDQPIKIPVSYKGLKNSNNYTISLSEFMVLPALAAPV